jgi:gas vesicle protein
MISDKKGLDLVIGAVVGTVLGAVTALLLAPKSGRELRADIVDGVQSISEKTQKAAETAIEKSKQTISEKTKQAAQIVSSRTSEWTEKAKETALTWKIGKQPESSNADDVPVAATVIDEKDVD